MKICNECPKQDLGRYEPIPRPKPSGECDCDFSYYYTKEETDRLINAIETGDFVIVEELPEQGNHKDIYLVPKEGGGYNEYIYINEEWEHLGDTDIDLSNYYTKSDIDWYTDDIYTIIDNMDRWLQGLEEIKQDKLTQGENIAIQDNVISAKDTTYTGGDNVSISNENVISVDLDDYVTQSALESVLDTKQDTLTAGDNVDITNNVVSVDLSDYATKTEVTTLETTLRELIDTKQDKLTKQDILDLLGYVEMPMSMEDEDGSTVDVLVIGKVV